MPKNKLATPEWILQSYNSEKEYLEKTGSSKKTSEKTFKVRECPECDSDDVRVVLGSAEGKDAKNWECKKCGWKGENIVRKDLTEDELLKYLDEKGEEIN